MRALGTLIHVGVFFGFLLGASFFATRVFPQEANWNGIFIQGQAGLGFGEHALSYEFEKAGIKADVYEIPLQGNIQAIGLGYRHELGDSNFYLGARLMVHQGNMDGSQVWETLKGEAGVQVDFVSSAVYTAGVELGYTFAPRWYGYLGGGLAGAELFWHGQVDAFGYEISRKEEGWAVGPHLTLGAMRDLGKGWALGGEAQWFHFEKEKTVRAFSHDLGSFKAEVDDVRLMVTLTKTF